MSLRLTVITPSFNQAGFIERTLRSVLDQGYDNLEYLVVDGGSTDGSVDIIRRYEEHLAWWVSEPDGGQTAALNKALRRATGDVIAYINSDDVYLPGAFDRAVGALQGSDARWVVGACRFEGDAGFTTEVWRPEQPRGPRHWWILAPWGVPQPSTFWRRDVFDELGPFREDLHYIFDTEHNLRCAVAGLLPALLPDDELAVRVLHDEAKSADKSRWSLEMERMVAEYVGLLTPGERRLMQVQGALDRAGLGRVIDALGPVTRRVRGALRQSQ
jgi:glycosyltransferase involved in cell wall biosynthesis